MLRVYDTARRRLPPWGHSADTTQLTTDRAAARHGSLYTVLSLWHRRHWLAHTGHGRLPRTRARGGIGSASDCYTNGTRRRRHEARWPLGSGGEQQRLTLARAWLLTPSVLFLDEPTSALDPAAIKAVEDAVNEFHQSGTRIVMTTHDLHQAKRLADDVLFMYGGQVLEHTSAKRFFDTPSSSQARAFIRGELVW